MPGWIGVWVMRRGWQGYPRDPTGVCHCPQSRVMGDHVA